jgi:hypothetical protein
MIPGKTVLDYGCGAGGQVLAMRAQPLGLSVGTF